MPIRELIARRPSEERRRELKKAYIQREMQNPKLTKEDMLTPQVRKVMENVTHPFDKYVYQLYLNAKNIEHLPNGIPYAVVDDPNFGGGNFVIGNRNLDLPLNKPLILVNSRYSFRERLAIAMHEFIEWKNFIIERFNIESHFKARKNENPRIHFDYTDLKEYVDEAKWILYSITFEEIDLLLMKKSRVKYIDGTRFDFRYVPEKGYEVRIRDKQGQLQIIGYFTESGFNPLRNYQ